MSQLQRQKKEKSHFYFKSFINLKQQEILNIIKLYQLLITNTYIVCRKRCRLNIGILSLCVKACKEQCKWKTLGIKKVFLVERKKKSKVKCTKQILQVHNNKNYSNIRTVNTMLKNKAINIWNTSVNGLKSHNIIPAGEMLLVIYY